MYGRDIGGNGRKLIGLCTERQKPTLIYYKKNDEALPENLVTTNSHIYYHKNVQECGDYHKRNRPKIVTIHKLLVRLPGVN